MTYKTKEEQEKIKSHELRRRAAALKKLYKEDISKFTKIFIENYYQNKITW